MCVVGWGDGGGGGGGGWRRDCQRNDFMINFHEVM